MPLTVRKFNAQIKDPQSGQMVPAGLLSSDSLQAIEAAEAAAITEIQQKGAQTKADIPDDYTELSESVGELKTQLDDLIIVSLTSNLCDPGDMEIGMLGNNGNVNSTHTDTSTTGFIPVSETYISAYGYNPETKNRVNARRIAFYDSDKSKLSVTSTGPTIPYEVPQGASFVRVSIYNRPKYFVGFSENNSLMPYEDYIKTEKINNEYIPDNIIGSESFFVRLNECEFAGNNVHLSIDDVGYALYLLKTEAPTSLWDNTFFGQLKTLHDTYGICVTCNCFNALSTEANYNISTIPNTWASEFVASKSWLKFAFHAKNNTIDYSEATSLVEDYQTFVSAIYTITGDYDCIDTGTRLTMFTGTEKQIKAVNKIPHGIEMLWTADDSRNSYYLDSAESARVARRGKIIDIPNNIFFVKSMPRLDNHTITDDIAPIIEANPQQGKMVELYCHENLSGIIASGTITRINNALTWFNTNGYKSHFLTDILA